MEELEQIMRRIHVLFAKCEPYGDERDGKIIVPKKEMFRLLEKLSYAVIRMMDEYEGTAESRERGLGAYRREGERIKEAAQTGADDVYAASLIYVDNMLEELHDVVADAKEELWEQYARMAGRLDAHARSLSEDQEEIKQLLAAMAQGGKYLKIIEHENNRLQQEEAKRALAGEGAYEDGSDEYWDDEERYEEEELYEEEPDAPDPGDAADREAGSAVFRPEAGEELHVDIDGENRETQNGGTAPAAGENHAEQDGGKAPVAGESHAEQDGGTAPAAGENHAEQDGGKAPVMGESHEAQDSGKVPAMGESHEAQDGGTAPAAGESRVEQDGVSVPEPGTDPCADGKSGGGGSGKKPQKAAGKQGSKYTYRRKLPAAQHARMVPDLEAEWAKEEQRPVRKIGTAIYEEVGQPYDAPVKRVSYEVKVNQAYFDQLGEGNIDLDAEYYQWKEEQEQAAAASEGEGGAAAPASEDGQEKDKKAGRNKKEKKKRGLRFGKRG